MIHIHRPFLKILLAAALLSAGALSFAQSRLPACPWFGVKHDCVGEATVNGQPYKGEFKNNNRDGYGSVGRPGEFQYDGEFRDNVYEGQGTLILPGGWKYVGEFKAGQFSGKGTLNLPDGRHYSGNFTQDNFDGLGTLTFPDGRKYVGQFKGDAFHGQGVEYRPDGSVLRAGSWDRDQYLPQASTPQTAASNQAGNSSEATKPLAANEARQPILAPPSAVVAAPMPAPPTTRLTTRALVIGNGAYTNFGRLANSRNDAQAIAAKLQSFGIAVDLVLDADRDTLVKALNDYAAKATGQDVNILFYAGHGLQIEGINYLIPTNMRADGITAGYVKLNGIALNAVMDYMPASTRLVFLDACRDNPASRSLVASRSAGSVGLAPVAAATGTLIAYATKEGAVAADGAGQNSPYTTALLRHLDAPLDISIVLRRVRQTVLQMTSNTQEPWEYGSLVGDQLILSLMAK